MRFAAFKIELKKCAAAAVCVIMCITALGIGSGTWLSYAAGEHTSATAGHSAGGNVISAGDAEIIPSSAAIIESYETERDNPDYLGDVGGEFEHGEYDGELTVPAYISLGRIEIQQEVFAPLSAARVSSLFGYRQNPVTGQYRFHSGYDLAAAHGTKIHAMYSGVVITAAYDSGYGNYVIIEHEENFQTLYAHCSSLLCEVGDSVDAGEVIALVGSTGNSTGAHLHVEFRRDGKRYDPEWVLGGIY